MRDRIVGAAVLMTASLAVAGCATMTLQHYVGHDLDDAVRRYGAPAQMVTLPDGQQAFKWIIAGTRDVAASAPLDTFMPLASAPVGRRMALAKAGALMGGMCVYTLVGSWEAERRRWVVIRYEPPRIDCA